MDIANLRLHLKDEYTYQEVTKEMFLNEVEKIFEDFKNSGDTELLFYKGACAGEGCENCGMKGYRFVGNNSKNYIDLLFETEGDNIKDITNCSVFKTNVEVDDLGNSASINFNLDDRVTFKRTPDYWAKVYAASAAYNEIITRPPERLNFEKLSYWLDKNTVTDSLIGSYSIFKSRMRWTPFSKLYDELKKSRDYISRYNNDIRQANSSKDMLKTEQELIDWIFTYEALYEAAPFDLTFSFEKEGDGYIFNRRDEFILCGEEFDQTYGFIHFYKENHENLFQKYNTYTYQEQDELREKAGYEEGSDDLFSLKFHLEHRKVMEELGINIPLYVNKEIMPF